MGFTAAEPLLMKNYRQQIPEENSRSRYLLLFYIIGNCSAFSYYIKASGRMRTDAKGILLYRNMHPARQKCALL